MPIYQQRVFLTDTQVIFDTIHFPQHRAQNKRKRINYLWLEELKLKSHTFFCFYALKTDKSEIVVTT